MELIRITEPRDGAITRPLQAFQWSHDRIGSLQSGGAISNLLAVDDDRSSAQPVTIRWTGWPADPDIVRIHLSNGEDVGEYKPTMAGEIDICHLHIGKTYNVSISGVGCDPSPPVRFTTNPATPRWISVPGTTNVRDAGGWSLAGGAMYRQGLLYRGAELNTHLQISLEGKRVILEELAIRTIIDLRGGHDGGAEQPEPPFDAQEISWINVPILPYELISDRVQMAFYHEVFQSLSCPEAYPVYFHCWGGADRTGTVAYLLGALLGMNQEDLYTDYELTSLSIWGVRSRTTGYFPPFLEELERYGDTPQQQAKTYLRGIGMTVDELDRLRRLLTEV